jgi:cysteine desulfuration protein SufE
MSDLPEPLEQLLEDFAFVDRAERAELLIEMADRFEDVPGHIATRPFPEEHHVTRCESQAYVWAEDLPDGTQKYHFAVENPQGLSAKAWAVILGESLSGQPLEKVVKVPGDVVFQIFGKDVSMGKGEGMLGMLSLLQHLARQRMRSAQS